MEIRIGQLLLLMGGSYKIEEVDEEQRFFVIFQVTSHGRIPKIVSFDDVLPKRDGDFKFCLWDFRHKNPMLCVADLETLKTK